jgi:uncharacterized protein (DUF305 family)
MYPARLITGLLAISLACHRPPASPSVAGLSATERADMETLYRARLDSARQRYSAADVAFVTGMIGHHAQALGMANLAPTNGASSAIRILAARIHNAQTDEIALMQRWLRARGEPVPEVHVEGARVTIHGTGVHTGHDAMPGMLSEDQLRTLATAQGPAFDRAFLTLMIQHHEGAITMVSTLFATDGAAQDQAIFALARDVQVDQRTEVARMRLMLAALPDTAPLPRP